MLDLLIKGGDIIEKESLLKVEGLKKYFEVKSGLFDKEIKYAKAVDANFLI